MTSITATGLRPTERRIAEVENSLGIAFPHEYRQFLLDHNGGIPEPGFFVFGVGPYSSGEVRELFGIDRGGFFDFERSFNLYKIEHDRIPSDTIAIGNDTAGNVILLTWTGVKIGAISLLSFGHGVATAERPYGYIYALAPSLREFLGQLEEDPDADEPLSAFNARQLAKAQIPKPEPPKQAGLDFGV
jgi:hypothetical protein